MKVVSTVLLILSVSAFQRAGAFSLLGPFKNTTNNAPDPWQGKPYAGRPGGLGYELPGDIGGPMFIHEGYRWNLPTIYYGFDKSFVDYFGQPGIDAVESAIAILNALPPASEMSASLDEFPLDTKAENPEAAMQELLDLKSVVLPILLEQLGLANPERFLWSLRARAAYPGVLTNYTVMNLNYDPLTYQASQLVNGVRYHYVIRDALGTAASEWASAVEWFELDPLHQPYSSVAGGWGTPDAQGADNPASISFSLFGLNVGQYFVALTRDDVGGIRYLLRRDNRAVEGLPPGITAVQGTLIDTALRGGVEKLSFVLLPSTGNGHFLRQTNTFADVFYTNDIAVAQLVQRVVSEPDILFRAEDLGGQVLRWNHGSKTDIRFGAKFFQRSDTSRWRNNAYLNPAGSGGPGVIPPGATITLAKLGRYAALGGQPVWGSFDGTGEPPIVLMGSETNHTSVLLETRLLFTNNVAYLEWTTLLRENSYYHVEVSTNLVDWSPFAEINSVCTDLCWDSQYAVVSAPATNTHRFYRTIQVDPPAPLGVSPWY